MLFTFQKDFIDYWDSFVEAWFINQPALNSGNLIGLKDQASKMFLQIKASSGTTALSSDELPEPYLGPAEECKFVIINYNPGGSQDAKNPKVGKESDKYYSNLHAPYPDGWLIKEYDKVRKYSLFQKKWSPLKSGNINNTHPVCGASWWQGANGNDGEMRWIVDFAKKFSVVLNSDNVFALEMCPYHSISKGNFVKNRELQKHYLERVIKPAAYKALSTTMGFAVCVGAEIYDLLISLGADEVNNWTDQNWNGKNPWPTAIRKGKAINRQYRLLRFDMSGKEVWHDIYESYRGSKNNAYFLVLSAPGSNKLPSKNFSLVECEIANYIKSKI